MTGEADEAGGLTPGHGENEVGRGFRPGKPYLPLSIEGREKRLCTTRQGRPCRVLFFFGEKEKQRRLSAFDGRGHGSIVMITRKYAGDYRLENVPGKGGKQKTVPIYQGEWFIFPDESALGGLLRGFWILTLGNAVGWILTLCLNCGPMRQFYVLAPMIGSGIALLFRAMALWDLRHKPRPYTRKQRDKITDRVKSAGLICALLQSLAAGGSVLFLILRRDLAGGEMTLSAVDVLFTALALALAAESWLTFAGARKLRMEPQKGPSAPKTRT